MIINFDDLYTKYDLDIAGVVHVGAHYGEEIPEYLDKGVPRVICFEPVAENFAVLKERWGEDPHVFLFNYALGNKEEVVHIYLSSNDKQSSSVLMPSYHLLDHPDVIFEEVEIVNMQKMNSFADTIKGCNFLSIDVQGYEYEVLEGANEILPSIDYLYLEVNRDETYEGNKLIEDIDALVAPYGFKRLETAWAARTWGDAFYAKR